jgi:ABC-type nitrate/sulfonate/bicarbonate transport system substrate-binding protein
VTNRQQFLGGAAALGASALVPGAAGAQSGKALTIGYVPSTLFAPVFVAQERGYLRDAGFNATLTPIVAGQDAMALVAQSARCEADREILTCARVPRSCIRSGCRSRTH